MSDGSSATACVRSDDVVYRRVGQGAVLVHLPSNKIFELNTTGARIWELIVARLDQDTIVETLVDEFEVAADRARAEVLHAVAELQREGLVQL
jgi:hypothetical protein